jgi:hypothetical protein
MGKRKRPRHRPHKKAPEPAPKPHRRLIRIVEWVVGVVGILASVLTIAGFWLGNAPKLSVNASESVASYSPMGTTFVLSNEGALEIHDVRASVANLHLENSDPNKGFQIIGMGEFTNVPEEAKAEILSPGHKMGLPYAPAFGFTAINNFTGGNLTIIVRYRPAYLWWQKTEVFPFRAVRTTSGSWIWKSVPQ